MRSRHPWIYSQSVAEVVGEPADGELLPVTSMEGRVLGWGFHSSSSLIAVRVVSYGEQEPREGWLSERLRAACDLRARLGIDSDAMRLVNAEGDFLPGLVADRYGDTIVIVLHARAMETRVGEIVSVLKEAFPGARLFLKRDEHYAGVENLGLATGYLAGDGDGTSIIQEAGVRFVADFAKGQKTGFYLDQRENRRLAAQLGAGRTVLNLFSYTGAFALRAAAGGAVSVVSVESSARAIEMSRRNAELNPGIRPEILSWIHADVFNFLKKAGPRRDRRRSSSLRPPEVGGRGRRAWLCRPFPPGPEGAHPRRLRPPLLLLRGDRQASLPPDRVGGRIQVGPCRSPRARAARGCGPSGGRGSP
jgi:23S rRNA (cytosine1962-C5)-methyltransferase